MGKKDIQTKIIEDEELIKQKEELIELEEPY